MIRARDSLCCGLALTQRSTLNGPVGLRESLCGTATKSSTPSRLNACNTLPATKVAPFCKLPLLLPWISSALPSPGHQATMPEGGSTHGPGVGVGLAGPYSSALYSKPLAKPLPAATSTLPELSSVAVCQSRPKFMLPVGVHNPVAGSYSSAL